MSGDSGEASGDDMYTGLCEQHVYYTSFALMGRHVPSPQEDCIPTVLPSYRDLPSLPPISHFPFCSISLEEVFPGNV